ncbi:XdhC family protein [Halalkalibacter alkalisediminis]|uniref:XdhC family protein n=1 Tax=Halalkalibacter alkalisediminis TaxID=935616 RepID=A0ABV6NF95_9BACI|nr:XdhC family protein [Halalkalibacter alkalisediminis]
MREFYNYLKILKSNQKSSGVIATVIEVIGSSYRHEGAKMLFLQDGSQHGLISGGCLEEDLKIQAEEVKTHQISKTITYDLQSEDDMGWGQGAGCNGRITVLLEPFQWQSIFLEIMSELENGHDVISIRGMTGEFAAVRLFITMEGNWVDSSNLVDLSSMEKYIREFKLNNQSVAIRYVDEYQSSFIMELFEAKEKLFIFGAGPDVEPIVRRAAEFDFLPVVIDPRESRCNAVNFPDAAWLVNEHPERFLDDNQVEVNSYVLIMTHSFTRDQQLVTYFSENKPKYLGVLGPKRRTERLLFPKKVPEWFHSPIGVDIDAEGAEEISVSILAELIQVRNRQRALNKKRKRVKSEAV